MSTRLVGRAAELAAVDALLAGTGPRLAVVVGEPGIGKTALLDALAERAERRALPVLRGRAAQLEEEVPFAVWADALDARVRADGAALRASLGGDVVAELVAALPGLHPAGASSAPAPAGMATERRRLAAAVRRLLEQLAPLVLVLDDLHWTDTASADVLTTLLRRPPAADVLLVAALRPRPAADRLVAAVDRAERDGELVRIVPAPLGPDDAHAVMGEDLDPALRARVLSEAAGNPFYLEQLARSARLGGSVPDSVPAAIEAELAAIPDRSRAALDGAAVAGDPFAPELVAVAAGLEEDEVLAALDDLRDRDLIRPTAVPRQFAVRHPLIREAVYGAADPALRRASHQRIAAALQAQGLRASVSAHHVARAAVPGDAAAVAHLRAAAAEVAGRAPDTAAAWLRTALSLLPRAAGDADRLAILEPLSAVLAATGRLDEAHDALEEALAATPSGGDRTALIARLASVEHGRGRHAAAKDRLLDELAALDEAPTTDRAALLFELAANAFHARDAEAMMQWAGASLDVAERRGDRAAVAAARSAP